MDAERRRLEECRSQGIAWRKWGPYLSERQWGTVREDYSESGDAWNYFSHDDARSLDEGVRVHVDRPPLLARGPRIRIDHGRADRAVSGGP